MIRSNGKTQNNYLTNKIEIIKKISKLVFMQSMVVYFGKWTICQTIKKIAKEAKFVI